MNREKGKLILLPEPKVGTRIKRQWQLIEILVLEETLREKREALKHELEDGVVIEPGPHRAWLQEGRLIVR